MEDLYQNFHYDFLPHTLEYPHSHAAPDPLLMYRPALERPLPPLSHSTFDWSTPHQPNHNYYNTPVIPESTRPKVTRNIWEDEETICYQVEARGIHVVRRHDNDMINGTKLLNVVGMSRGKRDGILKNERGRVVVKVGSMYLKGVWITFERAKELSIKFKIFDLLYPLFVDDPSVFLTPNKSFPLGYNWPKPPLMELPQETKYFYDKEPTTPSSWYSPPKRKLSMTDSHNSKMIKIEHIE